MNLLFLTLQYDFEKEKEYMKKSKVAMQGAANAFQTNLISGFKGQPVNLTVMNTLPLATFPKYRQFIMKTKKGSLLGFNNTEIGYINLPFLKQQTRYLNYKKQVVKWIKNTPGEKYIVAYSLYLPFEKIFKYLSRKYPDVKTCIICPDLPCEYGILPKNKIKARLQYNYGKKLLQYAKYSNSFAVLTEQMKEPLKIGNRKFTVIEGIANGCTPSSAPNSQSKVVLYTGTLNKPFGILNLLNAFSKIEDKDIELWICGGGNSKTQVEAAAQKDSRIKFFGYVSKDTVLKLQQEAFILINPRQNEGEYTKYSFPSKTMEYMLSAKPVLMYKLDGIPSEYYQYLNFIEGNTADDMKNAILEIFSEPKKALEKAEKAAHFVSENKNSAVQAKKIIDLMLKME